MNQLHIGFAKQVSLPKGSYLLIADEVPEHPKAKIFDPAKHAFNPLKGIEYKTARQIADVLYTAYPQGENTLTVRNGKRALLPALLSKGRLDEVRGDEEITGLIGDILASPVLRKVLCSDDEFGFYGKNTKIHARINRAELGEFDALVLGLLLISHFKGQIVVQDGGFYLRDAHVSLIRENRLILGVNFLAELPDKLRRAVLLMESKEGKRTTLEDAEALAGYAKLLRGTNEYNDFVHAVMG